MPRSFVSGDQVRDQSIEAIDLATDSVITEKIKDGNVTCPKLAPGICDRLLTTDIPIWRFKLSANHPEDTDFDISPAIYDPVLFETRVAVYRNGQLLFNGLVPPVDEKDATDVYPGTTSSMLRFAGVLRRGDTIQVILL